MTNDERFRNSGTRIICALQRNEARNGGKAKQLHRDGAIQYWLRRGGRALRALQVERSGSVRADRRRSA